VYRGLVRGGEAYDVFLSYSRADSAAAEILRTPIADRLQLVMGRHYGGAFHRSAEGNAVVADAVMDEFLRAWLTTH